MERALAGTGCGSRDRAGQALEECRGDVDQVRVGTERGRGGEVVAILGLRQTEQGRAGTGSVWRRCVIGERRC